MSIRDRIWNYFLRKTRPECELPLILGCIHAVLYPIDHIAWKMGMMQGYQPCEDVYIIDGVYYSRMALRLLSKANGETYRIARDSRKHLIFELIEEDKREGGKV